MDQIMRKFALLISAATVLFATSAFAGSNEVEYLRKELNLPPQFNYEMLGAAAGDRAVNRISKSYGVSANFTEADIITSVGEQAILGLRKRYSLAPNFNCDDLRRAVAAQELAEWMGRHRVRSGFTEGDLVQAFGLEEVRWSAVEPAKSSTDLGELRAEERLQEAAKKAGLSGSFTYLQYREAVGPSQAGFLRSAYGFSMTASYREMKSAIAKKEREDFAKLNKVSVDWTFEELVQQFGLKTLKGFKDANKITGPADEAGVAKAFAQDNWSEVPIQRSGEQCTEADIARTRGENTALSLRNEYDLEPGFTAEQVRESAGLSVIAKVHKLFGVTGKFTSEDLEKAQAQIDEERKNAPQLKFYGPYPWN